MNKIDIDKYMKTKSKRFRTIVAGILFSIIGIELYFVFLLVMENLNNLDL